MTLITPTATTSLCERRQICNIFQVNVKEKIKNIFYWSVFMLYIPTGEPKAGLGRHQHFSYYLIFASCLPVHTVKCKYGFAFAHMLPTFMLLSSPLPTCQELDRKESPNKNGCARNSSLIQHAAFLKLKT